MGSVKVACMVVTCMAMVGATIMMEVISCNNVIKNLTLYLSSMVIIYMNYC